MPGVPPDAVDNVKKLLKGMFRRGKSKRQDTPADSNTTSTKISDAPPQLPSTKQTEKPLPATHPLATGQHEEPLEAIPIDHNAQSGLPTGVQESKNDPISQDVSPTSAVAATSNVPGQVEQGGPAVPPKTDGAADVSPSEDVSATKENLPPKEPVQAISAQPAETAASTPAQGSDTTANITKPDAPATAVPAATATSDTTAADTTAKEPFAVEEPPAVPKTNLAPGMSATSGPLEDFPQNGDEKEQVP